MEECFSLPRVDLPENLQKKMIRKSEQRRLQEKSQSRGLCYFKELLCKNEQIFGE